jgi:hypothetical protein
MDVKPIVLSEQNWCKLRYQLFQTQPKSVVLTRWKMRKVLGFTDRLHTEWIDKPNKWGGMGYEQRQVHLDFYDESKKTFFLLKYSDWINSENSYDQ